jgi:hypothetical protein
MPNWIAFSKSSQVVAIRELDDSQIVCLLHGLDPLVGLALAPIMSGQRRAGLLPSRPALIVTACRCDARCHTHGRIAKPRGESRSTEKVESAIERTTFVQSLRCGAETAE